ncbi:Z1 domain-containing protein [Pseudidiomarina sp. E22-M8]|uniref:Z1 domain-containing protein n=1 Tax=Pseudidiomarina sp. E22-M8 TaxID=3424768 RepID=UPI00403C0E32
MNKQAIQRIRHVIVSYCEHHIEQGGLVDREFISNAIERVLSNDVLVPGLDRLKQDEIEQLKYQIETQIDVSITDDVIALRSEDVHRWLDHRRDEIDWSYWEAYITHLQSEGRAKPVIDSLEKVVDTILDSTGDPQLEGAWRRSGLVMGNVQSGKTQNYIGLINKAIDSGYKVIILLGGHLNELRNQTQVRVDEGVIGRESIQLAQNQGRDKSKLVGVGNYRDKSKEVIWFTSKDGDFRKSTADQIGVSFNSVTSPVVFVVKKNARILKTLFDWIVDKHQLDITRGRTISQPMLLIDDEADYASINTKHSKNDVTAINEGIRKLLSTSSRTTYVGYTATPFANIFIDPDKSGDEIIVDDLFPKDFMIKMPAPDNYIGHNYFFPYKSADGGQDASPAIKVIDDFEKTLPPKAKKTTRVGELCESLQEAVQVFMLASAVKCLKSSSFKEHTTMLVNMSHLTVIQEQVAHLIEQYVDKFKKASDLVGAKSVESVLRESKYFLGLSSLYDREFENDFSFEELYPALRKVISKLKTFAVNARSSERLDYAEYTENGLVAIAVGGHKLSRGLTLEGLLVSYFTRNSKMYDTLMQMCRWFGYRPGYKELCRLYITEESLSWYTFISEAIDELYNDLEYMSYLNKTPSDFGLKVREHPGALLVTARTKMQTAESCTRSLDYAGERYRRFDFLTSDEANNNNIKLVKTLIEKLYKEQTPAKIENDGSYLFYDVGYEDVIDFVQAFEVYDSDNSLHLVLDYIKKLKNSGVPSFRVCVRNQNNTKPTWWSNFEDTASRLPSTIKFHDEMEPITAARRRLSFNDNSRVMRSHKSELGDPKDENLLMGSNKRDQRSATAYIRAPEREFPGLIIYSFSVGVVEPSTVIQAKDADKIKEVKVPHQQPTVGFSLSFPLIGNLKGYSDIELRRLRLETKVLYQTNVIWREVFNESDLEDAYDDDE